MAEYSSTPIVDSIRQALLQPFSNLSAKDVKGLLAPTQTPLQAGLLGAMQGLQPYTGYTKTPSTFGQAIGSALMGAAGGVQQQKESNLTRALQGLQLYGDLKPDQLTGKAQEIAFYKARGFSDEDSQDLAYGMIEVNFDPDRKIWTKFNKATGKVTEIGGPISGSFQPQPTITSGATGGTTTDTTTKQTPGYGENFILKPGDLSDQQIENFKMDLTDVDSIMPLLDESIKDVENLFGISAIWKRFKGGVAGITPEFLDQWLVSPEGEKAKANYEVVKKKIISSFINNDRVPMGEQTLIREELLPDESSFFQDPQAAKIKLLKIKEDIQLFSDQAKFYLSGGEKPNIPKIKGTGLQNDPYILSKPEDIMNYKSGEFVKWQGDIIEVN